MKNGMVDLRNHLFDTLERLKDPDHKTPMDSDTAEAICLVAKRLLESAEIEIQYRKLVGNKDGVSHFLTDSINEAKSDRPALYAQQKETRQRQHQTQVQTIDGDKTLVVGNK